MNQDHLQSRLAELLADEPGLAAAYLFGSVARGTERAGSDVDLGLLYADDPDRGFDGLKLDLQARLCLALDREMEVVVLNHAPVDLVHRVLRDGKLLLNLDPSRRIAFEVHQRNEYWDLLPVLLEYRRLPVQYP